jgi:hypothetical protein
MAKNEYDESNFFLSFMTRPKDATEKNLQVAEQEEAKFNKDLRHQLKREKLEMGKTDDDEIRKGSK